MNKWQSADKKVTKEVIQRKDFTKIPLERAVCRIKITNVDESKFKIDELEKKFPSDIIYGPAEKTYTLGDCCSELDRQIERPMYTMFIDETSLITVELSSGDVIKFELTLLEFEPFEPIWKWPPEVKYEISLKYKEVGVELFKAKRVADAFFKFTKAIKILITLEPIKDLGLEESLLKKIGNLRVILYNNIAECHMQRGNYEHVVTLCSRALERDKSNVKALYRRGVAYGNLENYEKALEDLIQVLKLDPNNSLAKTKLNLFKQKSAVANEKYDQIVKRMFRFEL